MIHRIVFITNSKKRGNFRAGQPSINFSNFFPGENFTPAFYECNIESDYVAEFRPVMIGYRSVLSCLPF